MDVQNLASLNGLTAFNTCHCGGTYSEKFSDETRLTLEWKPGRYLGRVYRRNDILKDWTTYNEIEAYFQTKDKV